MQINYAEPRANIPTLPLPSAGENLWRLCVEEKMPGRFAPLHLRITPIQPFHGLAAADFLI
jgi:hypothetical protein